MAQPEVLSIQAVVTKVGLNQEVSDKQLEALIAQGARAERFEVFRALSAAYVKSGRVQRAVAFANRALNLWQGEIDFIGDYVSLMRGEKNAEAIRIASKRAGMWLAERGEKMAAILHFNTHHYAEQSTGRGDRYAYDLEILKAVEQLAGVGAQGKLPKRLGAKSARLRVVYIVFGANHTSSVLVSLLLEFARYHDKSRFDVLFFSPDTNVASRAANEKLFQAAGAELFAVDSQDDEVCLLKTELALRMSEPDLLVTVAALADYRQYYLFAACPAVARVSLCYGPPPQFVPPKADWVVSSTRHPLMDSPCDGSLVESQVTLPYYSQAEGPLPDGVVIPDGATLILAAGRSEKFLDRGYWESILASLRRFPQSVFVAFGLITRPDFLGELLESDIRERVTVLGWVENYYPLIARADIFVDTFPSGGGVTVVESMAFGVPVLSFSNDYLLPFDQANWNLGEEILGMSQLVVPRGDYQEFGRRLDTLIADESIRGVLGAACQKHVEVTRGNPAQMVRKIESEYEGVMARAERNRDSLDPRQFAAEADIEGLKLKYMQSHRLSEVEHEARNLRDQLDLALRKIALFQKLYRWLPSPLKRVGRRILKRIF